MNASTKTVPFETVAREAIRFAHKAVNKHPHVMHVGLQWSPSGKHECYVFTACAPEDGERTRGWRSLNVYVGADQRTMMEVHERDLSQPHIDTRLVSSLPVHDLDTFVDKMKWMVEK